MTIEWAFQTVGLFLLVIGGFCGLLLLLRFIVKTCGYLAMAAFVFFLHVLFFLSVT